MRHAEYAVSPCLNSFAGVAFRRIGAGGSGGRRDDVDDRTLAGRTVGAGLRLGSRGGAGGGGLGRDGAGVVDSEAMTAVDGNGAGGGLGARTTCRMASCHDGLRCCAGGGEGGGRGGGRGDGDGGGGGGWANDRLSGGGACCCRVPVQVYGSTRSTELVVSDGSQLAHCWHWYVSSQKYLIPGTASALWPQAECCSHWRGYRLLDVARASTKRQPTPARLHTIRRDGARAGWSGGRCGDGSSARARNRAPRTYTDRRAPLGPFYIVARGPPAPEPRHTGAHGHCDRCH